VEGMLAPVMSPHAGRLLPISVLLLGLIACGDDGSATAGGEGGSSSISSGAGGAGGAGGLPGPGDFLAPETYDCRGPTEPTPGPRPHDLGCLAEPGCESRFLMGHRMANPFGPENTLSTLRAAILLGVDVAETDIRVTADQRVVLIHDEDVDRTLDGSGDVSSLTLAEIQAMAVLTGPQDPGGDFSCDHAPSLEETMEVARGRIVVELETKNVEAALIAARYLRDEDLYDWAYIQGDRGEIEAVRAEVADVPIAFRINEVEDLDVLGAFDPPPILIEIDDSEELRSDPRLVAFLEETGGKVFTNVFTSADLLVVLDGDVAVYHDAFERGFDMVQSELPHLALWGLGRIEPR
jgi:glycerophosphoryl diester phosphodiesterase